ncbi:MAG: xanthine phosphoribosyltransferase [Deltaproteobacteria bacterium]|nr:xanthine phosphoribosyltransferase [Deltaproteobacteria bacterium]
MDELKKRIIKDGRVLNDHVLKVDGFLNHQIDVHLMDRMGRAFFDHFHDYGITKILTVETSGIAVACSVARCFHVPTVFARKTRTLTSVDDQYAAEIFSFTQQKKFTIMVSKRFITPHDKVLLVDDFLARGQACLGLMNITRQSGATLSGAGIVIEKAFQDGGKRVRDQGVEVYSLARISSLNNGQVLFE